MPSTLRRYNPLLQEWVIVSTNRLNRPWKGTSEEPKKAGSTKEVTNYLAPGAVRSNGVRTPDYTGVFVFDNDFPVFQKIESDDDLVTPSNDEFGDGLFVSQKTCGVNKVLCYHPNIEKKMSMMTKDEIITVLSAFRNEYIALKDKYTWVQIFENRGEAVGCSNPHPHCQIWATNYLPSKPAIKDKSQLEYYQKHSRPMLLDYLAREQAKKERIVLENNHWTVLVPYWAYWPFETLVLPHRHVLRFDELTTDEVAAFAEITKTLLIKYDNIFKCDFPFVYGLQGAPTGPLLDQDQNHWQFHAIYYPPLVRSATVRKFMAGYELLSEVQRDFTPEKAAEVLREQSDIHYKVDAPTTGSVIAL